MNLTALLFAALLALAGFARAKNLSPLKAGDSVTLEILRPEGESKNFNSRQILDDRGEITVPRLEAPVKAAGLTCTELAEQLATACKSAGTYKDPAFRVILCSCGRGGNERPTVAVGGEVKSPQGDVAVRDGMRLCQYIIVAGGFTEFADFSRVKVIRGKTTTIYDLSIIKPDGSNNPILLAGDAIHVPPGDAVPPKAPAKSVVPKVLEK